MAQGRQFRLTGWTIVGIAGAVSAFVILRAGRGLGFYFDEWNWIQDRRSVSVDSLLEHHNGHLSAVPILLYEAMFAVFGLAHYVPYRVLVVALHLLCCALLFAYLRRRTHEWFAVVATVTILFLGYAWQDLLWPFQIGFLLSVAGGLGALYLIDLDRRSADVCALFAIGIALASSGVGIPFAGAVAFELAMRRDTWRRLWVPLVPLALYGIWYLGYGESQAKSSNLDLVPSYTARAGAASIGALVGTTMGNGRYLIGACAVVLVGVLAQRRTIPLRLATSVVLALGYWALTALGRAQVQTPDASRYLYPGAIFVVLVAAEVVQLINWPRDRRWIAGIAAVVLVVLVLSVRGNLRQLDAGSDGLRGLSDSVRAELAGLELIGADVDPAFRPSPVNAPQVVAGPYFSAVDDLGSPALSARELSRSPDAFRAAADRVLVRGLGGEPVPADHETPTAPSRLEPVAVEGGAATADGACSVFTPLGGAGSVTFSDAELRLRIEAAPGIGADVGVRNLADSFASSYAASIPADATQSMRLPRFGRRPWAVQVVSQGPVRVCPEA